MKTINTCGINIVVEDIREHFFGYCNHSDFFGGYFDDWEYFIIGIKHNVK